MNIGVCTTDFETQPIEPLFDKIQGYGFGPVQLSFASLAECGFNATGQIEIPEAMDEAVLQRIKDSAERHGLSIVCVNGTFNMAHPDLAVRREGVRRFHGFARAVKALGCAYVTLCTGTRNAEHLWRAHPDNVTEAAWRDMAETAAQLVDIAKQNELTLLLEVEASNVADTPELAKKLIDEVGQGRMAVVMDCANLFHAGQAKPALVRQVIGHAFDVLGDHVALAHGKDIRAGEGVEFCGAGEGIIDFPYFFERLQGIGYAGDMVLHGIQDETKMQRCCAYISSIS